MAQCLHDFFRVDARPEQGGEGGARTALRLGAAILSVTFASACTCEWRGVRPSRWDAGGPIYDFDATMRDAPAAPDAGHDAGPTVCEMPQPAGSSGGRCRGGTTCLVGLECFEELTLHPRDGALLTLGTVWGLRTGFPDPDHPGEHLAGELSDVPIRAAPGGQCTRACDPSTRTSCDDCTECSVSLGGSPAFDGVFPAGEWTHFTSEEAPGVCRQRCAFDPTSNGGCPEGYTCSASENVCVEACVDSRQCALEWGLSRSHGRVAIEDASTTWRCDDATGRCVWTPPPDAAVGSSCRSDADCPEHVGFCEAGRCSTQQCDLRAADGALRYPCAPPHVCVWSPSFGSSFCALPCETAEACEAGQACRTDRPGRASCSGRCLDSTQCRTGEVCRRHMAEDATGECATACDPTLDECDSSDVCVATAPEPAPVCHRQDGLCFSTRDCHGSQACQVIAADHFGRCVAGCRGDEDCLGPSGCALLAGEALGVCVEPGATCSPSPLLRSGAPAQPLRGDAQCAGSERCSATAPNELGACVPAP